MPILFIHGVNNRASNCDYFRALGMRSEMFECLVVPNLTGRCPAFALQDEVYWGDLGARFLWGLRSVPRTDILESLGPDDEDLAGLSENGELLDLLSDPALVLPGLPVDDLETLGVPRGPGRLTAAARQDPARTIRAIAAPERIEVDPTPYVPGAERELDPGQRAACEQEGRERARILIASDEAARSGAVAQRLRDALDDEAVLSIVQEETLSRHETLSRGSDGGSQPPPTDDLEVLGISDAFAAGRLRIADLVDQARRLSQRVTQGTARWASLAALKAKRQVLTRTAGIFLGDVFEYLRRGQGTPEQLGTIARRVADEVLRGSRVAREGGEPMVAVTHSFGGILLYDLLTSPLIAAAPKFADLKVDLWVTVGSQVGLFAEMRAYVGSPEDLPTPERPILGKPELVGRWLNFYDAADVFSYLAEPVFGPDAVLDIPVREGANLTTAHGAYFAEPSFYRRIAEELQGWPWGQENSGATAGAR